MSARPTWTLLGQLLDDARHGRWKMVLSVLLAAAASGASVALMGVSGWLLSRAAEMPPVLYLQAAAVGVRFFGIARGVLRYVERLVGHDLALKLQSGLRERAYGTLSQTTLLGRRRGDLLTRVVADVSAIQDLVVRVAVPFCSASLVIIGTSVMLGRFSPGSAAVLFVSAVLAGVVLPWFTQRLSMRHDESAVALRASLADQVHQIARASQDLVATGADRHELARALELDDRMRRHEESGAWIRGLATAGQVLAAGLAVLAALWIGGQAVAAGTLKPRLLAVLVLTPLALHEVFATFTQSAQILTRSHAALGRLSAVLEEPPVGRGDVPQQANGVEGLVVDDLTIGWPGHPEVLRGLTLSVAPGERVAVVGESGIGKTTLAATVMGMIPPLAGRVAAAGRIGYLAQDAHIFATSIAENVRIGNKDATDAEVLDALERAGLDLAPDRVVGESGRTLSGGEAQRLALSRLLVGERDLWILDEPTEHLDHETATALMRDLWVASAGAAVLVITHDSDVMDACDRVIRLG